MGCEWGCNLFDLILQLMRLDGSIDALNMLRSESVSELNSELLNGSTLLPARTSFGKDPDVTPTKPFGLGMLRIMCFQWCSGDN